MSYSIALGSARTSSFRTMASGESSRGSTLSLEPMFRYKSANLRGDVETVRHSLERLLSDPRKRFMVIAESLVCSGEILKRKKSVQIVKE